MRLISTIALLSALALTSPAIAQDVNATVNGAASTATGGGVSAGGTDASADVNANASASVGVDTSSGIDAGASVGADTSASAGASIAVDGSSSSMANASSAMASSQECSSDTATSALAAPPDMAAVTAATSVTVIELTNCSAQQTMATADISAALTANPAVAAALQASGNTGGGNRRCRRRRVKPHRLCQELDVQLTSVIDEPSGRSRGALPAGQSTTWCLDDDQTRGDAQHAPATRQGTRVQD